MYYRIMLPFLSITCLIQILETTIIFGPYLNVMFDRYNKM